MPVSQYLKKKMQRGDLVKIAECLGVAHQQVSSKFNAAKDLDDVWLILAACKVLDLKLSEVLKNYPQRAELINEVLGAETSSAELLEELAACKRENQQLKEELLELYRGGTGPKKSPSGGAHMRKM